MKCQVCQELMELIAQTFLFSLKNEQVVSVRNNLLLEKHPGLVDHVVSTPRFFCN